MLRVLIIIGMLLPNLALAEKVATAVVNGRKVDIFANQTWAYQEEKVGACERLDAHVSFCSNDTWTKSPTSENTQLAQYSTNNGEYGVIISEGLGLADGMTLEYMVDAALYNMSLALDTDQANVPVLNIEDIVFNDTKATRMSILADYNGLSLIMTYTIVVDDRTYQIGTWRAGKEYSSRDEAIHEKFIKYVEID